MSDQILISICIPAYKRIEFLKRLLDSIQIQEFRNFEVVVTDDSADEGIKRMCDHFQEHFPISYYRNQQPLGTPENWNEAIRKAKGNWIKLMHDDDWFGDEKSLGYFAEAITSNPACSFIFSAFRNIDLQSGKMEDILVDSFRYKMLLKDPASLVSQNIIGPPSVILHKNDRRVFYDNKLKWLVDIDFYIRSLMGRTPVYINRVLVFVGIGEFQVTADCFGQRPVEIPENFYLLNRAGIHHLKNIMVYDAWWRLMRNLKITHESEIVASGYTGRVPHAISSMIRTQRILPAVLLNNGTFSKSFMFLHYLIHYRGIR